MPHRIAVGSCLAAILLASACGAQSTPQTSGAGVAEYLEVVERPEGSKGTSTPQGPETEETPSEETPSETTETPSPTPSETTETPSPTPSQSDDGDGEGNGEGDGNEDDESKDDGKDDKKPKPPKED